MGEFELIARFFKRPARRAALGVGDDCALLQPAPGTQLAISSDMLVEGRHFFPDVDPFTLGHKALAFTLALALPHPDEAWLTAFSRGLFQLADAHGCELIGGDTTRGPLNICITVFGEVPLADGKSQALLRSGARPDDDIYVSGTLGDARLALAALQGKLNVPPAVLTAARTRLEKPTPRIALGLALRGVASAAMDISDGLLGDLGHILQASGCGASIDTTAAMNLLAARAVLSNSAPGPDHEQQLACVLAGGDDYELLFTAPPTAHDAVQIAARQAATPVTRIGRIEAAPGLRLLDANDQPITGQFTSFDHFA